jgi:hypothetical protein
MDAALPGEVSAAWEKLDTVAAATAPALAIRILRRDAEGFCSFFWELIFFPMEEILVAKSRCRDGWNKVLSDWSPLWRLAEEIRCQAIHAPFIAIIACAQWRCPPPGEGLSAKPLLPAKVKKAKRALPISY